MNRLEEDQLKVIATGIRNSGKESFDTLFRTFYAPLVQMAYRYTRQKDTASDLVQDAFVTLWERRQEIDPERSISSYLYTIVRNLCLNYIRDHSREQPGVDEENIPGLLPLHTEPDETTESRQKMAMLKSWVGELPERQQQAFSLSRFEGLEHDEIATVMNISSRTVNNHIMAALDNLKSRYDEYKTGARSVRYG